VKHPAWYHNLKANPDATVSMEGDSWHGTARPATPRERDEIWAKALEIYPSLRKYEARAGERHIEASSSAGIELNRTSAESGPTHPRPRGAA
jgi:deazaflavin-dependent oxidoreductase (nitroreductase family)